MHMPMAFQEGESFFPTDEQTGKAIGSDVDYVDTYKAMEEGVRNGLTKSIGISNFNKRQVERILENCTIRPVTNQVELHPYLSQEKLTDFCKSKGIQITAFSQFGSPRKPEDPVALQDPKIEAIAKKYGKSACQIILRWLIQRDIVAIPKSVTKKRVDENINIFDFALDDNDMAVMKGLNRNYRMAKMDYATNHKDFPFNDEY